MDDFTGNRRAFKNGYSQAVRISKDFGFGKLTVKKVDQKLILEPARESWMTLNDESGLVGNDFVLIVRNLQWSTFLMPISVTT